MNSNPIIFVIPTYRLRDVAETVEKYDEHFWSNGHSVKMMIFDDELWPTLVEVCYFHKDKKAFPQMRVKNKQIKSRNGASVPHR